MGPVGLLAVVLGLPPTLRLTSRLFPGGPVTWGSAFAMVVAWLALPVLMAAGLIALRPTVVPYRVEQVVLFVASVALLAMAARFVLRGERGGGRIPWPSAFGIVAVVQGSITALRSALDAALAEEA